MINRFNDFLLEKKIYNLILESIVEYSDEFKNVLEITDHPISKILLYNHKKDKNIQHNFINLTDKNDEISFTPDRRSQQLLLDRKIVFKIIQTDKYLTVNPKNQRIYDLLEFERPHSDNLLIKPEIDDKVSILRETQSPSTGRTYVLIEYLEGEKAGNKIIVNKDSIGEFSEGVNVWSSSRNNMKIGRFVRAFLQTLGEKFTDKDIAEFVDKYKSSIQILNDAFLKFDVVSGDKLLHFYDVENYEFPNGGTLGNSCMKNADVDWLKIYSYNTEVCKLVILYSDKGYIMDGRYKSDKIIGRALLWKTIEGDTFMDRIYTANHEDEELFKRYAFKNNWFCKTEQRSNCRFYATDGNTTKAALYSVQLKNTDYYYFPYLDTLKYYCPKTKLISNNDSELDDYWILEDTEGEYTDPSRGDDY